MESLIDEPEEELQTLGKPSISARHFGLTFTVQKY